MDRNDALSEEEWDSLVQELFRTWHALRPSWHERPDAEMMGRKQILHVLAMSEGQMTPGALADACHVTSARIARALKQLEAQGLVVRMEDPEDGRRTLVSLTEKGQATIAERKKRIDAAAKEFLKELGAGGAKDMLRLMKRIGEIAPAIQEKWRPKKEGGCCR